MLSQKKVNKRKTKDDDEEKPQKKVKTEEKTEKEFKKVIVKGKGAVDENSGLVDCGRVFEDNEGVWNAMLNQTDINYGVLGHNKYYLIQLIEIEGKNQFVVFCKWGRVGSKGQQSQAKFQNVDGAKEEFRKKI